MLIKKMRKMSVVQRNIVPNVDDTSSVWHHFSDQLMGYIQKHVPHAEDAREILQEVFVKIHIKQTSLEDEEKLGPWIYRMTKNTIIDHYQKSKNREKYLLSQAFMTDQEDPYSSMVPCLKPFIKQLDLSDQELIKRIDLKGEKQKDLAKELGVSYSTLKSRVQNARKKLKQQFFNCCTIEQDGSGRVVEMSPKEEACTPCS